MLPARQLVKLAQNCGINAVTAIFGIKNGEILKNPEALETMKAVAGEVAEVFKRIDAEANEGGERTWDSGVLFERMKKLCEDTAGNTSSMLADVEAGRETEVEFINGYVMRKGEEVGVDCPVNKELVKRVNALRLEG